MNDEYRKHADERERIGIPPLPLDEEQVRELVSLLQDPKGAEEQELLYLLSERIIPGANAAAKVKADFLAEVVRGNVSSPLVGRRKAIHLLGTMRGGYNVPYLVEFLDDESLSKDAANALKGTILVFDEFDDIKERMDAGNPFAREVMESWAEAEWFTSREALPDKIGLKVYKVSGEVNTDDLSPASEAGTRSDIPLHAMSMGRKRFSRRGQDDTEFSRAALAGGVRRRRAGDRLEQEIGDELDAVAYWGGHSVLPEQADGRDRDRGEYRADILQHVRGFGRYLPIQADVSKLSTGREVILEPFKGRIIDDEDRVLSTFGLSPATLPDAFRAGGRLNLVIGRKLTGIARGVLMKGVSPVFISTPQPEEKDDGFTLAQKIVGKACGKDGVVPGEKCEPKMSTVGSQDTTGSMTMDELRELATLRFGADMVMQSFCHTAAYPTERDKGMHGELARFFESGGGLALKPGDGIIHSWINRLLVPDEAGTGGDSHTRFPLGISFPAGSGLVAFAAAMGFMPLEMPESVLVRFIGKPRAGITIRDVVNAIPLRAIELGLVSRPGEGTQNVFSGRIMEMEGMNGLSVEEAFELTCASAERSASAAVIALEVETVCEYLRSNVELMKSLVEAGYQDGEALKRRIGRVEEWLKDPKLLTRDENAEYAAQIEIDLGKIEEPIVACPNHPDKVKRLSEASGAQVDEVFIGSCMTNIGHFREAAKIIERGKGGVKVKRLWIAPPTRMDADAMRQEGLLDVFTKAGARIEIPGCSLCMGNQARVADGATVFSTSTRNFENRMGMGAQVYLGSARVAALTAALGRVPTREEYFAG